MIRAPRQERLEPVTNFYPPTPMSLQGPLQGPLPLTTSQTLFPEPDQPDQPAQMEEPRFNAVMRIPPSPAERLDDSWRERHARERKQSRKRQRRTRMIENLFESKRGKRLQKIGIASLGSILALTMLVLYLNQRSGGALIDRVFGR